MQYCNYMNVTIQNNATQAKIQCNIIIIYNNKEQYHGLYTSTITTPETHMRAATGKLFGKDEVL